MAEAVVTKTVPLDPNAEPPYAVSVAVSVRWPPGGYEHEVSRVIIAASLEAIQSVLAEGGR